MHPERRLAVLQILNILAQYGYAAACNGIEGLHRLIEAFKHTYAVRMHLADPEFVDVNAVVADMLDPDFAASLRKQINDNVTFPPEYYGGRYRVFSTTFLHQFLPLRIILGNHSWHACHCKTKRRIFSTNLTKHNVGEYLDGVNWKITEQAISA